MTEESSVSEHAWLLSVLPSEEELSLLGHDPVATLLAVAKTRAPVEMGFSGKPEDLDTDPEVRKLFGLATKAAAKLKKDPGFVPSSAEQEALHAFVHLVGRPALRTVQGELTLPPENQPRFGNNLELVNRLIRGVGRLDNADGVPSGTGWLIAEDLLITNNHVVAALCGLNVHHDESWREKLDSAATKCSKVWAKEAELRPRWSPGDTPSSNGTSARVKAVRALHPEFDAALLEVHGVKGSKDLVLPVSGKGPEKQAGLEVYVPGYPAALAGQMNATVLKLLFGGASPTVSKRVSPGKFVDKNNVKHDASTLGGSSGSPIIAFDDHEVRSLHYVGVYGKSNSAVPFWKLRGDPFLTENGITLST